MFIAIWLLPAGLIWAIFSFVWFAKRRSKKKSIKIPILSLILGVIIFLVGAIYNNILSPQKRALMGGTARASKIRVSSTTSSREQMLKRELSYLNEIAEVDWFEVDSNNVFIGFNKRPDDLSWIIRGAAVKGNKAINFGVHVWAIGASQKGWRPGDGPYWDEATARYGKIE